MSLFNYLSFFTEVVDLTKDGTDSDVKKYLASGPDFSEIERFLMSIL